MSKRSFWLGTIFVPKVVALEFLLRTPAEPGSFYIHESCCHHYCVQAQRMNFLNHTPRRCLSCLPLLLRGTVCSSRQTCELPLLPSTWSAQKHMLQCPRSSDGSAGRGAGCYRKARVHSAGLFWGNLPSPGGAGRHAGDCSCWKIGF